MSCVHLKWATRSAAPATADGCEDCLAAGRHDWVHLRTCLRCGHVGCCDSSPAKHASAHFRATTHPVVRSAEPGESWRFCYLDHELTPV